MVGKPTNITCRIEGNDRGGREYVNSRNISRTDFEQFEDSAKSAISAKDYVEVNIDWQLETTLNSAVFLMKRGN